MSKEKIESLSTLRIISKSKEIWYHILAVNFELIYQLSPSDRQHNRNKTFLYEHYHAQRREPMQQTEQRLYFPGPKLFIRPHPSIRTKTDDEYKRLEKLVKSHEFVQFAIERNDGFEEYVPLLFNNVRLILDELDIEEVQQDNIPRNIKRRKYYKEQGGYDKARIGMLHPEMKDRSLKDSLMQSYRIVNGTLPSTSALFDILKDYSRIISENVPKR